VISSFLGDYGLDGVSPQYPTSDDILKLIYNLKHYCLKALFSRLNAPYDEHDIITMVFGNGETATAVRYINAVKTSITSKIDGMYIVDGVCHLFTSSNDMWH